MQRIRYLTATFACHEGTWALNSTRTSRSHVPRCCSVPFVRAGRGYFPWSCIVLLTRACRMATLRRFGRPGTKLDGSEWTGKSRARVTTELGTSPRSSVRAWMSPDCGHIMYQMDHRHNKYVRK